MSAILVTAPSPASIVMLLRALRGFLAFQVALDDARRALDEIAAG